jgi:hypothetical protein
MSWLSKIFPSNSARNAEKMANEMTGANPTQCPTAETASASALTSEPDTDGAEENPFKQRRYFVKRGLYVENEEERAAAKMIESEEEITDRRPVDLKTLFPKLSLR